MNDERVNANVDDARPATSDPRLPASDRSPGEAADAGRRESRNVRSHATFQEGKCPNVGVPPQGSFSRTLGHFQCPEEADISDKEEGRDERSEAGEQRAESGGQSAERGGHRDAAVAPRSPQAETYRLRW